MQLTPRYSWFVQPYGTAEMNGAYAGVNGRLQYGVLDNSPFCTKNDLQGKKRMMIYGCSIRV